jgi:fructose-1,6-bisphosphatase/inositol monophosphatase family enzyme
MPRFRALAAGEVEEKTPGELVTVADREAEAVISPGLLALYPGSRVVGEEAAAADAALLSGLDTGAVWLVDPLDGTGNFVAGRQPFSVMVALLIDGEAVASWMLDPVSGDLAMAERGGGAFLNEGRIVVDVSVPKVPGLRGAILRRFLPDGLRDSILKRVEALGEVLPGAVCAGADYPKVARGGMDFVMFWRTLPWDHAPGALFLTEAGGKVARFDGTPYRPGDGGNGLLATRNGAVWEQVHATLLG